MTRARSPSRSPPGEAWPEASDRNRQPPWEKEALPTESGSFGDWLRRQREVREISLRDIADRTKISFRYLEAMEADRFDLLPAPVFAKGFLREYARYVGLSPDDVVNHYLSEHHPEELATEPKDDGKVMARSRPKAAYRVRPRCAGPGAAVWSSRSPGWSCSSWWPWPPGSPPPPRRPPRRRPAGAGDDRAGSGAPRRSTRRARPPLAAAAERADPGLARFLPRLLGGGGDRRRQAPLLRAPGAGRVAAAGGGDEHQPDARQRRRRRYSGERLPPAAEQEEGDVVHDLVIDLGTVQALKAKKEAR